MLKGLNLAIAAGVCDITKSRSFDGPQVLLKREKKKSGTKSMRWQFDISLGFMDRVQTLTLVNAACEPFAVN